MDYQLIANILLAVSAFFSLVAMLRWDLLILQGKDYSNKEFMTWLHDSEETFSTKRVIPMAALMACATPWARESWIVVLLIAIAMAVLTVTLLISKRKVLFSLRSTATVAVVMGLVARSGNDALALHGILLCADNECQLDCKQVDKEKSLNLHSIKSQ